MPIASGVNVLASAISVGSQTRIVALAAPAEVRSIFAVAKGAFAIVPRDVLPEDPRLAAGHRWRAIIHTGVPAGRSPHHNEQLRESARGTYEAGTPDC
jgi:hypothetical protein